MAYGNHIDRLQVYFRFLSHHDKAAAPLVQRRFRLPTHTLELLGNNGQGTSSSIVVHAPLETDH